MINIILSEDHTLVRKGLRIILEKEPDLDIVAETNNGQGVLDFWQQVTLQILY